MSKDNIGGAIHHSEDPGTDPTLTPDDSKATFKDVWENKRVLGFCKRKGLSNLYTADPNLRLSDIPLTDQLRLREQHPG